MSLEEPPLGQGPVEASSVLVVEALSERDRRRVRELQELLRHQGQPDYVAAQKRAARRLGISVRSVQRLLQRWRRDGVSGVVRQERCDKGRSHLSEEWQGYILKTWREGNREGRRLMSNNRINDVNNGINDVIYPVIRQVQSRVKFERHCILYAIAGIALKMISNSRFVA